MRLTTVILIASLMQVSASSLAQKITLFKTKAALSVIFKELKAQSGYNFVYRDHLLQKAKPVSIQVKDEQLDQVLKMIFNEQPFSYEVNTKTVIVKEKEPSITSVILNSFQNLLKDLTVRGVVKDQDGKPLPNASIRVKGKGTVINTNAEGEFEIKNVADDAVLLVSYVGFRTLELPLKDAVMPLEIKLNVATGELEEVKVVYNTGYQELNKERATGSFVQIDNELFNRRVGATVLDRISDLVPGLLNTNRRGRVNANDPLGSIIIRGVSTLEGNMRPLLVVDNFIYEGDPNKLNPNDDKGAGKGA